MNQTVRIICSKYQMIPLIIILYCLILGCSSHDNVVEKIDHFEKWRILAEKSQSVTPVHEKRPAQQSPAMESKSPPRQAPSFKKKEDVPEATPQLPEVPVTMRMHDVSVTVLLRTLARIADINIMINKSISGQVNVDIKSVPWNHVFLSLLDTYGLTHEWSGLILRVITVADLNKKKELMEAKQDYQQSKNQHSIAMLQIKKKQDWFEPLQTKIIKIQYADIKVMQHNLEEYLTTEIKDASKKQATEKGGEGQTGELRGSIMIDEFTNSLIIQATASEIDKIMPIINELDKPIKQIRIEAHIVEANTDVAKELGIEWGGLGLVKKGDNRRGWIGGDMGSSNTSLMDSDGNNIFHNPSDGSIVNLPITETDPVKGLALGIMAESLGNFRLYAQLSALEEEGELNILSKPSITTMDHRKAIIKSGEEVPYQTVTSDGEIQVEFKEAVIKLEVVPHIINDRIIRLEIVTHKDELDWTNTVNGNPTIITKNAETQVTLFDGQTTVIGGLNKEKSIEGESGVPGLKNVPGLGWLFKSTKKSNDMEELLIFITPYVLQEQGRF